MDHQKKLASPPYALVKRSVLIKGHRTSVSLESAFWDEIKKIAAARNRSINHLATEADLGRMGNLSSALRLLVLREIKKR